MVEQNLILKVIAALDAITYDLYQCSYAELVKQNGSLGAKQKRDEVWKVLRAQVGNALK